MFNPYKYMLEIRNNRILFQYLASSAVHFSDVTGWSIQGYSDHGRAEIYELSGGVVRFTLPIEVPEFITVEVLNKILDGLNGSIEGVLTVYEDEYDLFIEYHLHTLFGNEESLDKALLKFIEEREEIKKGFKSLEEDYKKMKGAIMSTMESMGNIMNDSSGGGNSSIGEPPIDSMDSLWNDMDNIDKQSDDEDDLPPEPTA